MEPPPVVPRDDDPLRERVEPRLPLDGLRNVLPLRDDVLPERGTDLVDPRLGLRNEPLLGRALLGRELRLPPRLRELLRDGARDGEDIRDPELRPRENERLPPLLRDIPPREAPREAPRDIPPRDPLDMPELPPPRRCAWTRSGSTKPRKKRIAMSVMRRLEVKSMVLALSL